MWVTHEIDRSNPNSVFFYLLVLPVQYLQHLVEYLEHNVSVYQPLHPHGGLLLLELLQEGENQFGETQHTVLYCTVLCLYLNERRGVQGNTSMRSREFPRAQPEGTHETECWYFPVLPDLS